MLRFVPVLGRASVVFVGLSLLTLQGLVHGQLDAHGKGGPDSRRVQADGAIDEVTIPQAARTVFVGRVIGPDGAPAVGAVVVTSAGGQAATDEEGAFSLEVELPVGSESVRVTAVLSSGTGSLIAGSQVGGLALWGTTSAGMLVLEQSAGCEPRWIPTFGAVQGVDQTVLAFTVFDDGGGPALYAGGEFTAAGGVATSHIAKWNGTIWSALGSGIAAIAGYGVNALTAFDDGSGPALYAGGQFDTAGGLAANSIAKWNGTTWSALGSGIAAGYPVYALTVFDDGSGPRLYVGGDFHTAGGVSAHSIANWNGSTWSAVGKGMNGSVWALAVFDDGSGPKLYAGGSFSTLYGELTTYKNNIAAWDGSTWSALGDGLGGPVMALAVFDDGSGPALYAGGFFGSAGGVSANYIAKWNGGSTWSALGSGMNDWVYALTVFDDGSGPALYAGGNFTIAGGVAANRIAKWDGSSWSALGKGMTGGHYSSVGALTVFDDGGGPALYAGGEFTKSPAGDSYLAKWGGCSVPPSPWSNLGSSLAGVSGAPLLEGSGTMEPGSQNVLDLSHAAPNAIAILFAAPSSLPTPFKGGIVLPDPVYPPTYGMTSASGTIRFRFLLPAGLPSGSQAWIQWGIQDAAAVKGVALSNAVEGVTP